MVNGSAGAPAAAYPMDSSQVEAVLVDTGCSLVEDNYGGVNVSFVGTAGDINWAEAWPAALAAWKTDEKYRGVWLHVTPSTNARAGVVLQAAVESGFTLHAVQASTLVLKQWLPASASRLPDAPHHQLGVAGMVRTQHLLTKNTAPSHCTFSLSTLHLPTPPSHPTSKLHPFHPASAPRLPLTCASSTARQVINGRNEVLAIQERAGPTAELADFWKLPGGLVDPGEARTQPDSNHTTSRKVRYLAPDIALGRATVLGI